MDQSRIKAQVDEALSEIRKFNGLIEIERAKIKAAQIMCDHPNRYRTSCMGETSMHCPDCRKG